MLSALIIASDFDGNDARLARYQESVVRSLAVLVRAAIADLVRDACIVGPVGARLGPIADHAGCRLIEHDDSRTALEMGLRGARNDRVLLLQAGFAPDSGFIDEISDWLAVATPQAAALRCAPESLAQRIFPRLAPVVGLVAGRADCLESRARDPASLARALRAVTLRTPARRVM
jgi:hypothetical protein